VYHLACLSIKCYFKVRQTTWAHPETPFVDNKVGKPNLCKNIIRAVTSDPKTPPLEEASLGDQVGFIAFAANLHRRTAHAQVTWHFYIGMLAFLNGEDKKVGPSPPRPPTHTFRSFGREAHPL
jgi:hypothetical protein